MRREPDLQEKSTLMSLVYAHRIVFLLASFVLMLPSPVTFGAQPNYDPLKPSAEFGTPEATAKIAARAGFLDVVGIKLGMPAKAALDVAKVRSAGIKMEPATRSLW